MSYFSSSGTSTFTISPCKYLLWALINKFVKKNKKNVSLDTSLNLELCVCYTMYLPICTKYSDMLQQTVHYCLSTQQFETKYNLKDSGGLFLSST